MDKVKVEYKIPKNKTVEYNGVEFEVTPFLTTAQQIVLINTYTKDYFGITEERFVVDAEYKFLEAEFNLINYVIQMNTNIEVDGLDENLLSDEKFFNLVVTSIENYWVFYERLRTIIAEIKEQKNSVAKLLSGLIDKAYGLLEKVSEISPEEIEKLQQTGTDLMKKLEETSLLGKDAVPAKTRKNKSK